MMFYFETPLAFLLLLLLPFLWKREKKHQKNNAEGIPFLIAQGTTLISLPFYIRNRNLILSLVQIFAFLCLVTALARPQSGSYIAEDFSEGRDLIIAVDTSGSMKALDFKIDRKPVSRLEALKGVVGSFIRERKGDRIGLIVFGEEVFTQCPLTSDHELLLQYLDDLEIGMAGDSTALGDGLALSVKRLKDIPSESKAVILVTDGLKTSGQMEPLQAAEIAKRLGVKVYTIGIGGKAPAPFPVEDIFGRTQITYLDIPVDDETLKQISNLTEGAYFSAQNTEDLLKIYAEIDRLEARKEVTPRLVANKEHFFPFLLGGLLSVLIGEFLSRTYLRIIS